MFFEATIEFNHIEFVNLHMDRIQFNFGVWMFCWKNVNALSIRPAVLHVFQKAEVRKTWRSEEKRGYNNVNCLVL